MTNLMAQRLAGCGRVLIIDLHSYPTSARPYELNPTARRPVLCMVRMIATRRGLVEAAREAFAGLGESVVSEPFAAATPRPGCTRPTTGRLR
jgi:N-formylglutamate deformylase